MLFWKKKISFLQIIICVIDTRGQDCANNKNIQWRYGIEVGALNLKRTTDASFGTAISNWVLFSSQSLIEY